MLTRCLTDGCEARLDLSEPENANGLCGTCRRAEEGRPTAPFSPRKDYLNAPLNAAGRT